MVANTDKVKTRVQGHYVFEMPRGMSRGSRSCHLVLKRVFDFLVCGLGLFTLEI